MAGQLIARGPHTWQVRIYGGTIGGKRKYYNYTIHGTRKEAQARLNKLLVDRDSNQLIMPSRLTLAGYLEEWKEKALQGRVTARTFDGYVDCLERYILPELGEKRLSAVTAWDIQGIYARMLSRGLSARTVRHTHAVIRNALKQATKWRILPGNVADSVDLPKTDTLQQHQALNIEQVAAFLAAVADSQWKALYHLLLNTGLRPGEAFGLEWASVDLVRCELVVKQTVTFGASKVPVLNVPKTKKARRVTFTRELVGVLLEHQEATREIANPLGLVFTTIDGGMIHPNNWSKRDFKSALTRANLPSTIRLYDLRHSMATLALAAGMHPKVVSERLGHATIKLTMDTYSHVTPNMQDQAGEQLAALIYRSGRMGAEAPVN